MKLDDIHNTPSEPVAEQERSAVPEATPQSFSSAGLDKMYDLADEMTDLEEALEDIKSFGGPEAAKKADRLIKSVHDFEPSITMIGQIKAGKTSLVNAMVGMPDLLPADVNPWTST